MKMSIFRSSERIVCPKLVICWELDSVHLIVKRVLENCFCFQSKMQARQTKNSSMMLNLSFWPLAAAADALVNETPVVVTCEATIVTPSAFFRRPCLPLPPLLPRFFFCCCRCCLPDLENRIPCGGFCPRRRVRIKASQPVRWSGRPQAPKAALAPHNID